MQKMTGKKVLVRTYSAGVHYGELVDHEGKEVVLKNTRRLWYWQGAFTLSEIALKGLNRYTSKLSVAVPEIYLSEAIEIIPVSDVAAKCIEGVVAYEC